MSYTCNLTIQYEANGGSGAPASQRYSSQADTFPKTVYATLRSKIPTRYGFDFLGWSESASATSASYSAGGSYSYTFPYSTGGNQSHTTTLYAVWREKEYVVFYRAGTYGSGTDASDIKHGGSDLTLRGRLYTRSGYNQAGWSTNANGTTFVYGLGGKYTANAGITLYPFWSLIKSTITSVTDSVPADGSTQGTVQINRPDSSFTHTVTIKLGTRAQEITNVGTSCTFTIPAVWLDQIPSSLASVATVELTTFKNGSQVGTPDTKSFTVTVPNNVLPTISLTGENVSDNSTVSAWNVLVQGYSKIALTALAAAGSGASISSIVFSGDGVSQTGTGTTVTSDLLQNAGSRTWTVTITDSRGKTATDTLTRMVYEYYPTAVLAFSAFRSTAEGNPSPSGGLYITAGGNYSFASCGSHNAATVKTIEYKKHTDNIWTTGESSAVSGNNYTFGTISILFMYDVRLTVTDALGSTASYTVIVSSVNGVSFGLNGQCARFGGPVQYPDRFECDWDAQFDGQIEAPLFLQTGSVASETVEAGTTKAIDITFGREFITNPFVAVSLLSPQTIGMDLCNVSVWNISKTGFSARLTNGYGSNRSLGVCWIAMARKDVSVSIADQPISMTVDIGDTVVFEVVAVNATNYQWYVMEQYASNWQEIPGDSAKLPAYTFQAVAAQNGCRYKCVVSNNFGSVESDAATLTIRGVQPVVIVDIAPYLKRASGGGLTIGTRMLLDKVVGGTVCWNQHTESNATATNNGVTHVYDAATGIYSLSGTISNTYARLFKNVTLTSGHKYFINADILTNPNNVVFAVAVFSIANQLNVADGGRVATVTYSGSKGFGIAGAVNGTNFDGVTLKCNLIDLTQMFGSAIANYIYALEQANAGAGVAWFKALFGDEYHEYAAGTLLTVKTSAHVMKDSNNNVIGNYPIDNIDLRGLPKLDANNKLYYDGDEYESDGTVTRNYGIRAYQSGDESLTDAITDGTNTVYKLTTPTTETATAFTNLQVVDPAGTEEYIDGRSVEMPVGHETQYIIS